MDGFSRSPESSYDINVARDGLSIDRSSHPTDYSTNRQDYGYPTEPDVDNQTADHASDHTYSYGWTSHRLDHGHGCDEENLDEEPSAPNHMNSQKQRSGLQPTRMWNEKSDSSSRRIRRKQLKRRSGSDGMMRREKLRTFEQAAAFENLKRVIPIHPEDKLRDRDKLSRKELLDSAIKYIKFLEKIIEMQDNNEI